MAMQGLSKTINLCKNSHLTFFKRAFGMYGKTTNTNVPLKGLPHIQCLKKPALSSFLKYSSAIASKECVLKGPHTQSDISKISQCRAQISHATRKGHDQTESNFSQEEMAQLYHQENLVNSGWLIRLANENGYLSWCRNTYLTTVVGAAMFVQGTVPYAKEAAEVLLLIGGLNLVLGTGSFVYNLIACRTRTQMRKLTVVVYIGLAMFHLLLWVFGVTLYSLGYDGGEELIDDFEDSQDV